MKRKEKRCTSTTRRISEKKRRMIIIMMMIITGGTVTRKKRVVDGMRKGVRMRMSTKMRTMGKAEDAKIVRKSQALLTRQGAMLGRIRMVMAMAKGRATRGRAWRGRVEEGVTAVVGATAPTTARRVVGGSNSSGTVGEAGVVGGVGGA